MTVGEDNTKTRRFTGPESRTLVEIQETRARLKRVITAGKKYVAESAPFFTGEFARGHRDAFLQAMIEAEAFLGVFLVLIVPTLLLQ